MTPEDLEREAEQLIVAAKAKRAEAAKLRARAEREADPILGVRVDRWAAFRKVREDPLLPMATIVVEEFIGPFTAADLAVKLAVADVNRAAMLLWGLADLEKVERWGDGWVCDDGMDPEVRDYAVSAKTFTFGDAMIALGMSEMTVSDALGRLCDRGIVTNIGGQYEYVEPERRKVERIRRRPPEQDPPAFTEAPARGLPIRIVDHGKRAQATTRHREKLRDQRYQTMEAAKAAAADAARAKAEKAAREISRKASRRRAG